MHHHMSPKFYIVNHYSDVMKSTMASQITGISIVCSNVCSEAYQTKHESSLALAFVRGIHRSPVVSPNKLPVTRRMFQCDDVIANSTNKLTLKISIWMDHGVSSLTMCCVCDVIQNDKTWLKRPINQFQTDLGRTFLSMSYAHKCLVVTYLDQLAYICISAKYGLVGLMSFPQPAPTY